MNNFLHKLFGTTPGKGVQPKEAVAYSIAGFGENFICTIIGSYLTIFMTDALLFGSENFMVGDSTLDVYKMLSILKSNNTYCFEDVKSFLNGYLSIRTLPSQIVDKWIFYDVYYSLRSVRRAINDKHFRNSDDQYIMNADISAQRKNSQTLLMANWLEKYVNNLH